VEKCFDSCFILLTLTEIDDCKSNTKVRFNAPCHHNVQESEGEILPCRKQIAALDERKVRRKTSAREKEERKDGEIMKDGQRQTGNQEEM